MKKNYYINCFRENIKLRVEECQIWSCGLSNNLNLKLNTRSSFANAMKSLKLKTIGSSKLHLLRQKKDMFNYNLSIFFST